MQNENSKSSLAGSEVGSSSLDRRTFLEFLCAGAAGLSLPSLAGCTTSQKKTKKKSDGLRASTTDKLRTLPGIHHKVVIEWKDKISDHAHFGFNNDFVAFIKLPSGEAIMMVNHESVNPTFLGTSLDSEMRSLNDVTREQKEVGVSLVHMKKTKRGWRPKKQSKYNRRIDGTVDIPFSSGFMVAGRKSARGTLANCAGGVTPWGTFLTCEENFDQFYDVVDRHNRQVHRPKDSLRWSTAMNLPSEHYGWVVEIEPISGKAEKKIALGRFAHEGATTVVARDGRCVVYMGDDANSECIYKFISNTPGQLDNGTLYVLNIEAGKWIALERSMHPVLQARFKSQTEVFIYAREAAKLVGGSPMNRPEDIEIHPLTGEIFVALTNNSDAGDDHGSILKIQESENDYLSLDCALSEFLVCGPKIGLSCPDNLLFDPKGNLWITNDISGKKIEKGPYKGLGNNALFFVATSGPEAGVPVRVVEAPMDAELTGPAWSPDMTSLFLSVQHPGETTKDAHKPTSLWPNGKSPVPAVVEVSLKGTRFAPANV